MSLSYTDLETPVAERSIPAWAWGGLIALLAMGVAIRIYHIQRESQWVDEFWSVYISSGRGDQVFTLPGGKLFDPPPSETLVGAPSWPHIWTGMDATVHPPLYHIALRWWMDIFGESDESTRGFSSLMSLVGVVVLFDTVRRTSNSGAALAAAAVMTMAATQIDYSQETRSYTMLALAGLIACHAMVRIEQNGTSIGRLIELAIGVIGSALTHYFSLGSLVALGVYALVQLRGVDRKKSTIVVAAAGLFALLVWSPWLWHQYQRDLFSLTTGWLLEEPHSGNNALLRAMQLPARHIYGRMDWPMPLIAAFLIYLLPLLLVRRRPQVLLWWFWMAGTIGMVTAFDLLKHGRVADQAKYTFMATPALCALLVAPLPLRGWRAWILPWLVVGSVAIAAAARVQEGPPSKPDWRALARMADRLAGPHDPIVFYRGTFWYLPGFWYLAFTHYVPDSQRPVMMLYGSADEKALTELSGYKQVWLFGDAPAGEGPKLLPGWIPAGASGISQVGWVVRMVPGQDANVPSSEPTITHQ